MLQCFELSIKVIIEAKYEIFLSFFMCVLKKKIYQS